MAGIKFVDRSEADKALEEERKALKKQKKNDKKVCRLQAMHVTRRLAPELTKMMPPASCCNHFRKHKSCVALIR